MTRLHEGACDITIRHAAERDVQAMTAIYNQAVETTTATFDTQPKTEQEQLDWFRAHDAQHPVMVAERDGAVVGWTALSKWSEKLAYSGTVETSIYIDAAFRGQGIGRCLKEAILEEGRRVGLHTVIARIAEGNDVSLHLNESLGFRRIGVMREVGRKFGQLLDVHLLQKMLTPPEGDSRR